MCHLHASKKSHGSTHYICVDCLALVSEGNLSIYWADGMLVMVIQHVSSRAVGLEISPGKEP